MVRPGVEYDGLVANKVPPTLLEYQLYVPPGAVAINVADELGHTVTFKTVGAKGFGFIVIVKLSGIPTQEFKDGVTVTIPLSEVVPLLEDTNEGTFPVPDVPNPIDEFEFTQL